MKLVTWRAAMCTILIVTGGCMPAYSGCNLKLADISTLDCGAGTHQPEWGWHGDGVQQQVCCLDGPASNICPAEFALLPSFLFLLSCAVGSRRCCRTVPGTSQPTHCLSDAGRALSVLFWQVLRFRAAGN